MLPQADLKPDAAAIRADLEYMTARWGELDEQAMFEVRAFKEGAQTQTAKFAPDWMDDAVEWIVNLNNLKFNIYAVRNPIRHDISGSASDSDILASFYLWADCDDEDSAGNVYRFDGPKYSAAVVTGTVPSVRVHTYWQLNAPCIDLDKWRDMQTRIAAHFGSDGTVVNPSRIMRVGGTVSFPAQRKRARGYVEEICTIRTEYPEERAPVSMAQMDRVFAEVAPAGRAAPDSPFNIDTGSYPQKSVTDYADILRRARTDGEKHSGVRDLTASMAGAGVPKAMCEAVVREACPVWDAGVETLIETAYAKFSPQANPQQFVNVGDDDDWLAHLVVNSRGRAVFNTANAMLVLENHPDLKGCFAYDEFRQVKLVARPLPGSTAPKASFKGRDYRDSDTINVAAHFNRNGFPDATKTTIADAIDAVAERATFHPVRNYLEGLPEWDRTERIDGWLQDYCNVTPQGETQEAYVREVGAKWLISAVARVMQPGCKADGVLILEGAQGARKSTTLRFLAGEDWFGDSLPPMSSKDASDYLRGKWIIELAELSNINKAEVEVVKAFISRESERFRPAYARTEIAYPRQCVFAGSTNKSDYLRDETGNRRFWPVKVNALCDTTGIREDRDQIWAEALHRYKAGDAWWLSAEGEEAAKAQQEQRVSQDAWEGDIRKFCAGKSEVSPTEVGTKGLSIELGRLDRASTNRITAVLTALGYARRGQFTVGENKGRARYTLEGGL